MKTKFELGEKVWVVDEPISIENCNACGQTLHVEEDDNVFKAVVIAMCFNADGQTNYSIEAYEETKEARNFWWCGDEPLKYTDDNLFKTKRSARTYDKAFKKQLSHGHKYLKKKK